MSARAHHHHVDRERVAAARVRPLSSDEASQLAGLPGMLAGPARSRILFAFATAGELCVGALAPALEVIDDQASYRLKMPRLAGLVSSRAEGRMPFYRLGDGFLHPLLEPLLRQLLTIAAQEIGDARP